MRTILLTGANGQVGWELQRTLSTLGTVVAPGRDAMDLSRPDSIKDVVHRVKPDLIVNPAAYTAVDKAETDQALAYAINAEAPKILATEAESLGITLVHFSTDYVFDGTKSSAYLETDATNALGVYAASKRAGEQAVEGASAVHLILRTSWVYGLRGKNFLLTMQRLAREREELRVVNDQFGAPTWSRTIAEATAQILAMWMSPGTSEENRRRLSGIYHLSCAGKTTWHDFAASIMASMRAAGDQTARLKPITTAEYPTPARRPANSVLSNQKLRQRFGILMPAWDEALRLCLA
jgi:dTDP-4-dehydrorhamnose reductase